MPMTNDVDIMEALNALQLRAEENHAHELSLVREAARRLQLANNDLIAEVEQAMREYQDGRERLARKLVDAATLIGRLPAPPKPETLSVKPGGVAALPNQQQSDPFKIFADPA